MKIKEFNTLINETLNSDSFNTKSIWKQDEIRARFNNPDKYPNFPFWRYLNFEIWTKVNGIKGL
jgi:asparagine synthase (glutamine-hydrolysing)